MLQNNSNNTTNLNRHIDLFQAVVTSFCLLLPLLPYSAIANDSLSLQLHVIDESQKNILNTIDYNTQYSQIETLQQALQQVITDLQRQAFLTASIDSVSRKGNEFEAFLQNGI